MSNEENENLQKEEIEALSSIFGKDWQCVDNIDKVYNVIIANLDDADSPIVLQIVFCDGYPLNGPPIYRLSAPWIRGEIKLKLSDQLQEIYLSNMGQPIVFLWIERIKEFLYNSEFKHDSCQNDESVKEHSDELNEEEYENSLKLKTLIENSEFEFDESTYELPNIIHGEPVCDRKSTFQAHLAVVKSRQQVKMVLEKLKESRKISNATHNIMAYRIVQTKNNITSIISNCDDDGETGAGSRMLFLMKTLEVENVMVVVSRWYGGIHLGPDRFKHINNCCRDILRDNGYVKEKTASKKKKH